MNVVVGVSDARTSNDPDDVLVTHALGSCIGLALYDKKANVGGLLHYQLPSSDDHPERGAEKPFMFADTGVAWLLKQMIHMGADKRHMRVRMAGGAKMLNDHLLFDIGRRNHVAIRKILWQQGMFIESEHVGGTIPRTMLMRIDDGSLIIKSEGKEILL